MTACPLFFAAAFLAAAFSVAALGAFGSALALALGAASTKRCFVKFNPPHLADQLHKLDEKHYTY